MRVASATIFAISLSALLGASNASYAQSTKGLFDNEKLTLACQQYVNTLYPAGQGTNDRQRESVFRACLRRKGK
jgi:hypothetical protein